MTRQLLLPLLILGACAEKAGAPSPPTPEPLTPTLVRTDPADGAKGVGRTPNLLIEFSLPMDPTSVMQAIALTGANGDALPLTLVRNAPTEIVLRPAAPLDERSRYTVTLAASAESTEGVPVAAPVSSTFETGGTVRVTPKPGELRTSALDCTGAYDLPAEFTGPEGLGKFGWSFSDLVNRAAWQVPTQFTRRWISDNANAEPSIRVRPQLTPLAGHCFVREIESAQGSLAAVLEAQSAFIDESRAFDSLQRSIYVAPTYDQEVDNPFVAALWGLYEMPNPIFGGPAAPPWSSELRAQLETATAKLPPAANAALGDLVLALGEASMARRSSISLDDEETFRWIAARFFREDYASNQRYVIQPTHMGLIDDIRDNAARFDLQAMLRGAQRLARAAEIASAALAEVPAFDAPSLDLVTPHGRIIVRTAMHNDTSSAEQLDDVILLVDLGGNDTYEGRYASTHHFWMSASVLIDVRGDDRYSPSQANIEQSSTSKAVALGKDSGFAQGFGLFGVGLLIDVSGDDVYGASVFAQGSGVFGVGALVDQHGDDVYRATYMGQGAGYFGVGVHLDREGNDRYVLGSMGQGLGRPGGHGLLLDGDGDDLYLALYNDDGPELPGDYPSYFPTGPNGYVDNAGEQHNISGAQGVGWGYRGDWFPTRINWAGGFGALLDLGEGKDTYFADCMSMGQGFVYGFGMLYDGGGDDHYRNFWWGFGSGTHMGTGLMIEAGGNDDLLTTRGSAALGHDTGVSWFIDHGGDDKYGGVISYGRSLSGGLSFFIEDAGDDIYTLGGVNFGVVQGTPLKELKRIGMFLDLGGMDTYPAGHMHAGNARNWYSEPVGDNVDLQFHKGVGIDK